MNPMGRIFGIQFASLHADAQHELFVFVGTGLDCVWKNNHLAIWAIGKACFITQGFQFPFYLVNIIGHIGKDYATGVGLLGMAINRLSSFRLTQSSPLYSPLSPCRM